MPVAQSYGAGGPRIAVATANRRQDMTAGAVTIYTDELLSAGMPRFSIWALAGAGDPVTLQPQFSIRADPAPGGQDEWLNFGPQLPLLAGVVTVANLIWPATKFRVAVTGGANAASVAIALGCDAAG
jgi:hypothetical protein